MNYLLVSSSVYKQNPYLDHCLDEISSLATSLSDVLFIPYALHDYDLYEAIARKPFAKLGLNLTSIHHYSDPIEAVRHSQAIFIGGGNTFRLLKEIISLDLILPLKSKTAEEFLYIGSSAGANVAGPNIGTTNDMPIVWPPTLDSLGYTRFLINPHFMIVTNGSMESRADRIHQFHEENSEPVLALEEGIYISRINNKISVKGEGRAFLFERNKDSKEIVAGSDITFLN